MVLNIFNRMNYKIRHSTYNILKIYVYLEHDGNLSSQNFINVLQRVSKLLDFFLNIIYYCLICSYYTFYQFKDLLIPLMLTLIIIY